MSTVTDHPEVREMPEDRNAWNLQVTEEFRANGGAVGGPFEGKSLLLLHHTGAKSGTEYTSPLAAFLQPDGRWAIVASNGGRDEHPSWYFNLLANPETVIEAPDGSGGVATQKVTARVLEGSEREAVFSEVKANWPGFAEYEAGTTRVIPVVVLDPVA
jgi:deazaflavin-dependent oxidoreductase (nitroreductase family)